MIREFKYFRGNKINSKNYYFVTGGMYFIIPYIGYHSENYMNGLIEHVRSVYRNFEMNEFTINNIKGHIRSVIGEEVVIQVMTYPATSVPL
jgi:hypothetical protein